MRTAVTFVLLAAACQTPTASSAGASAAPAATSSSGAPASSGAIAGGTSGSSDAHYIYPDDWFAGDGPMTEAWMYVHLSKQSKAPSEATKLQGEYYLPNEARSVWTEHAWRSRPATDADLKVGQLVICFEGNNQEGVYGPPIDRENARTQNWFMAKIADTSDLFKGHVLLSGDYKAAPSALRVPLQ